MCKPFRTLHKWINDTNGQIHVQVCSLGQISFEKMICLSEANTQTWPGHLFMMHLMKRARLPAALLWCDRKMRYAFLGFSRLVTYTKATVVAVTSAASLECEEKKQSPYNPSAKMDLGTQDKDMF